MIIEDIKPKYEYDETHETRHFLKGYSLKIRSIPLASEFVSLSTKVNGTDENGEKIIATAYTIAAAYRNTRSIEVDLDFDRRIKSMNNIHSTDGIKMKHATRQEIENLQKQDTDIHEAEKEAVAMDEIASKVEMNKSQDELVGDI